MQSNAQMFDVKIPFFENAMWIVLRHKIFQGLLNKNSPKLKLYLEGRGGRGSSRPGLPPDIPDPEGDWLLGTVTFPLFGVFLALTGVMGCGSCGLGLTEPASAASSLSLTVRQRLYNS